MAEIRLEMYYSDIHGLMHSESECDVIESKDGTVFVPCVGDLITKPYALYSNEYVVQSRSIEYKRYPDTGNPYTIIKIHCFWQRNALVGVNY